MTIQTVVADVKTLNIHEKIHEVVKHVRFIQHEDKKVNGQYSFVSHDSVTAEIRHWLGIFRLNVYPSVIKKAREGNLTEVEMKITLVNIDKPEEREDFVFHGEGIDPQDKGAGKAQSYSYKNGLLKIFMCPTGEDPERDLIDRKGKKELLLEEIKSSLDKKTQGWTNEKVMADIEKKLGVHLSDIPKLPEGRLVAIKSSIANGTI